MRNPWANETYSGPWSDTSSTWTEEFKKQVPYKLENQGEFFISLRDFTKGFPIASITYVNDSFVYSYFHRKGGAQAEAFSFKAKSPAAWISLDFYNDRMYPYGCSGEVTAVLSLVKDGSVLDQIQVESMNGFGYLYQTELELGAEYRIQVS